MEPILVIKNVTKSFGKLMAVNDVSFAVGKDEIFGIAGPNGAGKTTLFNVISGLPYHVNSGRIYFAGEAIESRPAHRICRLGLARTFQKETLFDTLSVLNNVLMGSVYGANDRKPDEFIEKALKTLEFVGLTDKLHETAGHLALFEKKLLMLASALATQPKVLLLDEPAAGLNQPEMDQSADLFQRINSSGTAIILIEHQLPLLMKVSERVMILDNGQKLADGPPEHIVKMYFGGN